MADTHTLKTVPFTRVPKQTQLFLNYLESVPAALDFYQRPPVFEALVEMAGGRLSAFPFPRKEITTILGRQNERFGADAACLRNIDDLGNRDCFAVVTGQQVGLFAGPLYTIYKAFTAIRIAKELRARNIRAVPVFWLDTDDHDLAEVTHGAVRGAGSSLTSIDWRPLLFGKIPDRSPSVGPIKLPEAIREVIDEYFSGIVDSPWKAHARARVESAYRPETSFAEAFGRFMAELFAGHGLVLFDPRDVNAKRLIAPVFHKALAEAERIHDALSARTRALEAAGFHAQVAIQDNSTLLFIDASGERKALIRDGQAFALKAGELHFSLNQLLQTVDRSPEQISPNVLLRPLTQDFLFPTICYVGGPGEIAYFAQVEVLYQVFDRPMPAIWPRFSLTLLPTAEAEMMNKFELALEDCWEGRERLLEKILRASGGAVASNILVGMQDDITRAFEELRPAVTATEASLAPALETAKRKIFHHLQALEAKFFQGEARRNDELVRKAQILVDTCYPGGSLQEREIGICPFLSSAGPGILDTIYSLTKVDSFSHHVAIVSV
jgi:bacillithiol biosynthesis cysteine-adding enzyme BshC